jgi:hypothetical protein
MSQNTTSTTVKNSIGMMNAINADSYDMLPYLIANNYAVGGGTLATVATDIVALGNPPTTGYVICASTNEIGNVTLVDLTTENATLVSLEASYNTIVNHVCGTHKKNVTFFTTFPRTLDNGVPLNAFQLSALKRWNALLLTKHNPVAGVIVIPVYEELCSAADTPNPADFKNETGKLLHVNPSGSLKISKAAVPYLKRLGFREGIRPDNKAGNLFKFGNIDGTGGGVASTNASGQVALGFTVSGSGGVQSRVCSLSATGMKIVWNPISGDGASPNVKAACTTNIVPADGYAVGDKVIAWMEVTVGDALRMDGPYITATETGSPSTAYTGFNKAGASTGFMVAFAGKKYIATNPFTIPATNTSIKIELVCQADCVSNPGKVELELHAMGLMKV